jgi:hypothetical protein
MDIFSNFCKCLTKKETVYADIEISNFQLVGHDEQDSSLIKVKLDLYFHLNAATVQDGDFLYLSPYTESDEDPVLLIDDSYK